VRYRDKRVMSTERRETRARQNGKRSAVAIDNDTGCTAWKGMANQKGMRRELLMVSCYGGVLFLLICVEVYVG